MKKILLKTADFLGCCFWYAFIICFAVFYFVYAVGLDAVDSDLIFSVVFPVALVASAADRLDYALLKRKKTENSDVCVWEREKDETGIIADTSCGHIYVYSSALCYFKYCPYCGRRLDVEEFKQCMSEDMNDEDDPPGCLDCSCSVCCADCPDAGCDGFEYPFNVSCVQLSCSDFVPYVVPHVKYNSD